MIGFGQDSNITTQQYKQIREAVIYTARQYMLGREIIGVNPSILGFGKQTYEYNKVTEMKDAIVSYILEEHKGGTDITPSTLNIPIIQEDWFIDERDLESSQTNGTPVNTRNINSASYKIALKENEMLVVGTTGPTVNGLYNSAGNTEATAADFGTYGKAITKVKLATILLKADKIYPPYNMVLEGTQMTELQASQSSTGIREMPVVESLLGGGRIYEEPSMTAATGMLIAANGMQRGMYEYILARDLTISTKRYEEAEQGGLKGKITTVGVPVVYDTNSICSLTGI